MPRSISLAVSRNSFADRTCGLLRMFDNALSGFKLDFECGAAFWHFNVHIPVSMASLVQHRNGPSNYFLETAYTFPVELNTEFGFATGTGGPTGSVDIIISRNICQPNVFASSSRFL